MRRLIPALAVSALLIVSIAACKSSSSTSAGSGGKPGAAAVAAGGGDAHLPTSTNICSLLPAATVAQVTGTKFDTGKPDSTPSYELYSCEYTSTSVLGAELVIGVEGLDGSAGYGADLNAYTTVGGKATTITGLGDKAFSTTIAGGAVGQVDALFGSLLITANGLSTLTNDQAKQLISTLHGKLG